MFEKLGGRKFVLALITMAVGTAVQILSPHGVTESFVALLVGISATFGAANAFVSAKAVGTETAETEVAPEQVAQITEDVKTKVIQEFFPVIDEARTHLVKLHESQSETIETLQKSVATAQQLAKAAISMKQ